jgi:hypothetical protein
MLAVVTDCPFASDGSADKGVETGIDRTAPAGITLGRRQPVAPIAG